MPQQIFTASPSCRETLPLPAADLLKALDPRTQQGRKLLSKLGNQCLDDLREKHALPKRHKWAHDFKTMVLALAGTSILLATGVIAHNFWDSELLNAAVLVAALLNAFLAVTVCVTVIKTRSRQQLLTLLEPLTERKELDLAWNLAKTCAACAAYLGGSNLRRTQLVRADLVALHALRAGQR